MRTLAVGLCLILVGCAARGGMDAPGMSFEEFQRYQQVAAFADAGGDLDQPNSDGVTPLIDALSRGYGRLARYLVSRGANVRAPDVHGRTPLHVAVGKGDLETAQFLLSRGAEVNAVARVVTPIALAAARLDVAMSKLLLAHHADPNLAPLLNSIRCGWEGDTFFFEDPAHPGDRSKRRTMNFKVLSWPEPSVRPPLATAVEQGNLELAGLLLDAGARLRFGGWGWEIPVLLNAVQHRNAEMTEFLLGRGADPKERMGMGENENKLTALHMAAAQGDLKIVQLLVGKGADVHAKDHDGVTPLTYAERGGIHEAIDEDEVAVIVGVKGEPPPPPRPPRKREPDAPHRAVIDYLRAHGAQ